MQDTRQQIMKILKERGQATVEELSTELGLTSATIRHHLDILRGDGLIETPEIRRRATPGRPQYVYTLTKAASHHFPQNYAGLANMILSEIKDRLGAREREAIMRSIAGRLVSEFPAGPLAESFETRLSRVIDFLNDKGYMARYNRDDAEAEAGGEARYHLYVTNCPYRDVVQVHGQICVIDMNLLTQLLNVKLRRVSYIVGGGSLCVFQFSQPKATIINNY